MAALKVTVHDTREKADIAKARMEEDGFQADVPARFTMVGWDATQAGGVNALHADKWAVVGKK